MRVVLAVVLALSIAACKKTEAPAPAAAGPAAAAQAAAGPGAVAGKVLERIDAAPYSYLKLQTATGEAWAAVPQTAITTGTEVTIESAMPMEGFESKTLNRKFDKIYFGTLGGQAGAAGQAAAPTAPAAPAAPQGAMGAGATTAKEMAAQHASAAAGPGDAGDVKVPKATGPDARTVAEIHSQKAKLKEKKVVLRGKVVKANSGIMGKNWFHLRDGSGTQAAADNDVTVTSSDNADVGDVVVITGTVRVDKDFGAGYAYPVIIEDATIAKK